MKISAGDHLETEELIQVICPFLLLKMDKFNFNKCLLFLVD